MVGIYWQNFMNLSQTVPGQRGERANLKFYAGVFGLIKKGALRAPFDYGIGISEFDKNDFLYVIWDVDNEYGLDLSIR